MRVKIKDVWYDVEIDGPIMIELTDMDKHNISNMFSDAYRYASFHDDDTTTVKNKEDWMNDKENYKR